MDIHFISYLRLTLLPLTIVGLVAWSNLGMAVWNVEWSVVGRRWEWW